MEQIADLGKFFSGPGGGLVQAGTAGVGTVGNILNMIQRGQQYSKVNANENLTPQQLAAKVSAATQPLNAGLVQAVTNQVQGADAERGLATSPGIFNSDLSQALAPYQQQNQNTALSLISQQLGLPTQAAGILNPTTNLSSSWANALKLLGNTGGQTPTQQYNPFLQIGPTPPPQFSTYSAGNVNPPDIPYPTNVDLSTFTGGS